MSVVQYLNPSTNKMCTQDTHEPLAADAASFVESCVAVLQGALVVKPLKTDRKSRNIHSEAGSAAAAKRTAYRPPTSAAVCPPSHPDRPAPRAPGSGPPSPFQPLHCVAIEVHFAYLVPERIAHAVRVAG